MFPPRCSLLPSAATLVWSLYLATTVSAARIDPEQHVFSAAWAPNDLDTAAALRPSITPELSAFIETFINVSKTPGLSLAVVHTGHNGAPPDVELGAWGRKTEDGDGHDMTPDVSF